MQGLHVATGLPVARFGRKAAIMKMSGSGVIGVMLRSRAGRLELQFIRNLQAFEWKRRESVMAFPPVQR
ncbi:MAG: hypothetical protein JWN34_5808 [Bryobacterales bacterium]|jgi:diphthamide synthase subunit DPH2|nr:hypothetical protein [Bryobacterales bacterium]